MPIICLEGASAVGKSTTSKQMATEHGAFVIEEVNKLFDLPEPGQLRENWYLDRQTDRWVMAKNKKTNYRIVILDGDVIQTLWYRWCFNFEGWNSLENISDSYRKRIVNNCLGFPSKYFVLSINEEELRKRKESDTSNRRRNFELHLNFIEPQRRYFEYLSTLRNDYVVFIEASSIQNNIQTIIRDSHRASELSRKESLELFDNMVEWVRVNKSIL